MGGIDGGVVARARGFGVDEVLSAGVGFRLRVANGTLLVPITS
jgi:hypothetical protein